MNAESIPTTDTIQVDFAGARKGALNFTTDFSELLGVGRETRSLNEGYNELLSQWRQYRSELKEVRKQLDHERQKFSLWRKRREKADKARHEFAPYYATATPVARKFLVTLDSASVVTVMDIADESKTTPNIFDATCELWQAGLIRFDQDSIRITPAGKKWVAEFLSAPS